MDPAHLRDLASHCRTLADSSVSEDVRATLLRMAADYEISAGELETEAQEEAKPAGS